MRRSKVQGPDGVVHATPGHHGKMSHMFCEALPTPTTPNGHAFWHTGQMTEVDNETVVTCLVCATRMVVAAPDKTE